MRRVPCSDVSQHDMPSAAVAPCPLGMSLLNGLCPFQNLCFYPCPFALVSKRAGDAVLFGEGVSAVAGTDEVCRADVGRIVEGEPFTLK